MKTTNLLYWITTVLFALFMAFTSIPTLMNKPEALQFMQHLGYPLYFCMFISVAKILGAIALLIPGRYRFKEWAYAGMAFDIIGAFYSIISVDGFNVGLSFLVIALLFLILSYVFYHKKYGKA